MDVQGLKVLVIDDSNTIRRTAETLLAKAGCDVSTASDGFDSLSKIVDIKPDVIFIDITIPLIDFAALQQTKPYSDFGSSTRIVVLNSLIEGHEHRYYAIMCKGFPHTIRVEQDSALSAQDEVEIANCISVSFDLDGQHLDLPDFEEIETHLRTIPNSQ